MKQEITEFDIFEALDRTYTLQSMLEKLLGHADECEDSSSVHRAVEKHSKLLQNVQENLYQLYQRLGEDLDKKCEEKEKANEKQWK